MHFGSALRLILKNGQTSTELAACKNVQSKFSKFSKHFLSNLPAN